MAGEIFTFFVETLWGSLWLAIIGNLALLTGILIFFGRASIMLMLAVVGLYLIAFGILAGGLVIWLPLMLGSVIYFFLSLYKFLQD